MLLQALSAPVDHEYAVQFPQPLMLTRPVTGPVYRISTPSGASLEMTSSIRAPPGALAGGSRFPAAARVSAISAAITMSWARARRLSFR